MKSLYLSSRFFIVIIGIIFFSIFGFFYPSFYVIAKFIIVAFVIVLAVDIFIVYGLKDGLKAKRITPEKLSNSDENLISITLSHSYNYNMNIKVIDELPMQFQKRDFLFSFVLLPNEDKVIDYTVRPVERGEYVFGAVNVFVSSFLSLVQRRYVFDNNVTVPCYPSFIQMHKYELIAMSNRLTDFGLKKIRRVGHQMEFDQIRDYVKGDDYRTINWKATARKSHLMVNQYQDEKAQPIYSVIDCGRVMKMPFNGLSLLDYAINTSLVMTNIAVLKYDKAGLICFDKKVNTFLPAAGQRTQVRKVMQLLYNQTTNFPEPNYELLYAKIKHNIRHRSLMMIYTNFESVDSMKRQLTYFKAIAKYHLLVVVFFANQEIINLTKQKADNIENIYVKVIGEKFIHDKLLIVKELEKNGIHTIFTKPENLTVNTINKYLEFKARGII